MLYSQRVMGEVPGFVLRAGPMYAYVQVAEHLEGRIRSGELAPGSQLRSERDLAEAYGVALGTLRKAVRLLRDKGLLVSAPSKGIFVSDPLP